MLHVWFMVYYISVKIPESFREEVQRLNEKYNLGYASLAEFVKEAMRKRFEEIRSSYKES